MRTKILIAMALSVAATANAAAQVADTLRRHGLQQVEVYGHNRHRGVRSSAPEQHIDRQEMLQLGVTDVADALRRLPGATLRDYGGAGGLKTVAVRGFGAAHTGVMYDGVLLSECQSGEIDVSRYSLDNVAELKLTIGDNDDIFIPARQASAAAVLAIETLNGTPADRLGHLTAQLKAGSFGYVSPFVRYVQQIAAGLTLSAMAEYTYAENDYPFKLHNGNTVTHERRTNSRMNSGHGELSAAWRINSGNHLWAKAYYYDNSRQLPGIVRYYTNVCGERLRDRNLFLQARWLSRLVGERLTLKANAKYNWASAAYEDTLKPDRKDDATYHQREYYASAALLYQPSRHWAADYSADYAYNNLNSTLATDVRPYRHSLLQSLTVKYTARRLVAMARVLGSVYYNGAKRGESGRDFRRLSPSVSVSYRLLAAEELYIRGSYKNIFRVPTFNELYFFHYGSTDLQPERTNQFNIGLTWRHQWRQLSVESTVDGYLNRVRDKIVGVPYNMFVWRTVNVARVNGKGLDANLKANCQLSDRQKLHLSASYSYQRVANHTNKASEHYGKQIAYTPLNSGSAAIGWENPWVSLSVHGSGTSSRWANNNHYDGTCIGGYWDTGITVYRTFHLRQGDLAVRADVKNVLGQQYEIVGSYPMPRRSWQASVSYTF